jgi:hypothetical protein
MSEPNRFPYKNNRRQRSTGHVIAVAVSAFGGRRAGGVTSEPSQADKGSFWAADTLWGLNVVNVF